MNEIILDTETTGLSPEKGDRILEIACIETKDLIPTKKVFYKLINPEREVSEDAFKIHGYSYEKLKREKKFEEIADEFLEFINGKKLIIHNAPFDISFINHELKKINKNLINTNNVVDTLEIARGKFPGTSNSLDNLCKRYGIDSSKREKHNALLDCQLLREVYINLIDQKEPTLSLNETVEKKQNVKKFITKKQNSTIVIEPTEKEYINHKDFLKKEMKKNYF
ncbi:MAG: DNA polymerase III subunit epsilon [Candidatus Marinimicrobia bacterium]|nr:DNA polymerase III subunit epsilon [Candidatus Neomarinimicrobiota bacterium]RPG06016.1 MAG: DNA polymerase III subunit epsilon [Pelagibacteraceae bacterium TMED247]|tara:strand:+ start:2986 stop:3657 length:672 start_codon:yes stop_codon:yes gene_type:complete